MSEETTEQEIQTDNETETESTGFEQLPDDHPLVKTLAIQKQELKDLRKSYSAANHELDEIRKASLTDQERLVENARQETMSAMKREFAGRLVEAELKTALNGRSLDGNAILGFDKNKFIDSDGEVDTVAITEWVESNTKPADPIPPDLGQGIRGKTISGSAQIRSRDDLSNMSNAEILAARKDGRLDALMGRN